MSRSPRLSVLVAALVAAPVLVTAAPALADPGPGPASVAPGGAASAEAVGGALLGTSGRVLPVGAPPVPAAAVAHGWLVADLDTGAVLGAQDPHGRFAPASTMKVLTATALMPLLPDRGRVVAPTYDDIAVDGSKVGLVERMGYPVDDLFAAMLMVSGNDAANTLATAAGGPVAVEAMNATAARLQAHDTHAVNPSGLDAPGQVSSAYDLALVARAAMAEPDFRRWVSTVHGSIGAPGGRRIATLNHDKLLTGYPGAIGIKNGYTTAAQASFVAAATRDGHTLLVTMMRTRPRIQDEAAALLDWGFAATRLGVQPVGQLVDPVDGPSPAAAVPARVQAAGPAVGGGPDGSALVKVGRNGTLPPATGDGLPGAVVGLGLVAAGLAALRARRLLVLRRRRHRWEEAARGAAPRDDAGLVQTARRSDRAPRPAPVPGPRHRPAVIDLTDAVRAAAVDDGAGRPVSRAAVR